MQIKYTFRLVNYCIISSLFVVAVISAQQKSSDIGNSLSNLYKLTNAESRSISPENFTGEKGKGGMTTLEEGSAASAARDLGQGWKVNPYVKIKLGETFTLAEIKGPGAIQHIWMTPSKNWRLYILRIYWDDEKDPSVEVPLGDFFAAAYKYKQISSLAVCVNPGRGFNCYWVMPFRKKCEITLENLDDKEMTLYYQIDYSLTQIPSDAAYFHAQFRRTNPLPYKENYTILDGVEGKGQYVGTYLAWQSNNSGWWGEGEVKFYIDGDKKFPTICGTGTEDYFCGAYNFAITNNKGKRVYSAFTTPYTGFYPIKTDGYMNSQTRFGMYRWHITDPIRFDKDLKVTIQALGWRSEGRYLPLRDDIASVAYWYQQEPHNKFPPLPSKDELEIN